MSGRAALIDAEAQRPLLDGKDGLLSPEINWKRIGFNADWPWGVIYVIFFLAWLGMQAEMVYVGREAAHGVNKAVAGAKFWSFFARHPDIPGVLTLVSVALAAGFVVLLQRQARITLWTTLVVKALALLILAAVLISFPGGGAIGLGCIAIATAIISAMAFRYKDINYAAAFFQQSCGCLRNHWGIWFAALSLQVAYFALLYFYVLAQVAQSSRGRTDRNYDPWGRAKRVFASVLLAWTTFFLNQGKLLVVSVSTITWYFPANRLLENAKRHPAMSAWQWVFTSSAGTLAMGGLLRALYEMLTRWSTSEACETCCPNILDLIKMVTSAFKRCLTLATRHTIIAHAFTSRSFFRSARNAMTVLEHRAVQALVSHEAGDSVVRVAAYVMALLIGAMAFVWSDLAENFGAMASLKMANWTEQLVVMVLFLLYLLFTYYPLTTLIVISATSGWFSERFTPLLMSMFVAALVHIAFTFMAEVILDASTAILFCYAVEKANHAEERKLSQSKRRGVMGRTKDAKAFVNFINTTPVPSAPPKDF